MIPVAKNREIQSSGISTSQSFGISKEDEAHVMSILRDTLYSDKVLAVLREYSSNAWDSHRMAGKEDVPIRVVLPTREIPVLTIEDFGVGISSTDISLVYAQYGASTKRGDNLCVGALGIGSKSGFAYSDTFLITSCHGGLKQVWSAAIDESEKGTLSLMHEEPCGDATGVKIQIPVKTGDFSEFRHKAVELYRYFDPRPDINAEIEEAGEAMPISSGKIYAVGTYAHNGGKWVAVMGCVPYKIDVGQLEGCGHSGVYGKFIKRTECVLSFDIGDLEISASREGLKYSAQTKEALSTRFEKVFEELLSNALKELSSEQEGSWSKRLKALEILEAYLPLDSLDLTKELTGHIDCRVTPKSFSISPKAMQVAARTKLWVMDDARAIQGYLLTGRDFLVKPAAGVSIEDVEKELEAWCGEKGIVGIPSERLSSREWSSISKYRTRAGKTVNTKHKMNSFILTNARSFSPYSDNWTSITRESTDDDVYVFLNRFNAYQDAEGENTIHLYHSYRMDRDLFGYFDYEHPKVYGYKIGKKLDVTKINGTPYHIWRRTILASIVTPETMAEIEAYLWSRESGTYSLNASKDKEVLKEVQSSLGKDHPIADAVRKISEGSVALSNDSVSRSRARILEERLVDLPLTRPAKVLQTLLDTYPLTNAEGSGISCLWGSNASHWLDYIHLVDSQGK